MSNSVGSELTLFMQGIVEGKSFEERISNPTFWPRVRAGAHNRPLNEFLSKASGSVRKEFHNEVTYASVPLETVDWSFFDIVSVDLLRKYVLGEQQAIQ